MTKKRTISLLMIAISTLFLFMLFYIQFFYQQPSHKSAYEKIASGEPISYLIIGDSIGRGSGASQEESKWFYQMERALKKKYDISVQRELVVQSGATAFEGLYLFKQRKLVTPDLVFVVFGENDRKYMKDHEFIFFYTFLLQEIYERFPATSIITLTESSLDDASFADAIKQLSAQFQTEHIDMRIPFKQSNLSLEKLTKDLVHPNDLGYKLYAKEILATIDKIVKNYSITSQQAPPSFSTLTFNKEQNYVTMDDSFTYTDKYFISSHIGAKVSYEFTGTFLGMNVKRSLDGGMVDIFIDDNYVTTMSTWWPNDRERALYITSGLENTKHTVTFQISSLRSKHSIANGTTFQIHSILYGSE